MNIFTAHTDKQNITYTEHLIFASRIGARLLVSVIAFFLHGIFPFINIRRELDLEATAEYLNAQNIWIEEMKQNKDIFHAIKQ